MPDFDFDVTGAHGPCCKANIAAWIDLHKKVGTGFTITDLGLADDFKKIKVTVSEEGTSKADVQDYLQPALKCSGTYAIIDGDVDQIREKELLDRWWLAGVGLGSGLIMLLLPVAACSFSVMCVTAVVSSVITLGLGKESFLKAKGDLFKSTPKPGMDSLFALSTLSALGLSLVAIFVPGLPMMFEVGLLIFGFRHLGIAMKESMTRSMAAETSYHSLLLKKNVRQYVNGGFQETPSSQLRPGDVLLIPEGEMIPWDGWLIPARTSMTHEAYVLDISKPFGTTTPQVFPQDAAVLAGMIAQTSCWMRVGLGKSMAFGQPDSASSTEVLYVDTDENQIRVWHWMVALNQWQSFYLSAGDLIDLEGCDHTAGIRAAIDNRTTQHLSKEIREQLQRGILNHAAEYQWEQTSSFFQTSAQESAKTKSIEESLLQTRMDTLLGVFIPSVVLFSAVVGLFLCCCFSWIVALVCVMGILVTACPCTFGLIMPLVMKFAIRRAESEGILIYDPDVIEILPKVNTLLTDLHHTLTQGELSVDIDYCQSKETDVRTYLALLEQSSNHFIGKTIYRAIKGDDYLSITSLQCQPTQYPDGVIGDIGQYRYYLGSHKLLARWGIAREPGYIYLVREQDGEYVTQAMITVRDKLQPDAPLLIQTCQQRGWEVHVATGTDEKVAKPYQTELNLPSNVMHTDLWPVQADNHRSKTDVIDDLKKEEKKQRVIIFLGDGTNDASALAKADVGILKSYADAAYGIQPKAAVRIMPGRSLMSALILQDIARQAMDSVNQNMCLSLAYNLMAACLSTTLWLRYGIMLNPSVGALLMVLQIAIIFANVLRQSKKPLPSLEILRKSGLFSQSEQRPEHIDLRHSNEQKFVPT